MSLLLCPLALVACTLDTPDARSAPGALDAVPIFGMELPKVPRQSDAARFPLPLPNGRTLFTHDRQVWSTNGTAEGTFLVAGGGGEDFVTGSVVNGSAFFSGYPFGPTYRTDGMGSATPLVSPGMAAVNGLRATFERAPRVRPNGKHLVPIGSMMYESDGSETTLLFTAAGLSHESEVGVLGDGIVYDERIGDRARVVLWSAGAGVRELFATAPRNWVTSGEHVIAMYPDRAVAVDASGQATTIAQWVDRPDPDASIACATSTHVFFSHRSGDGRRRVVWASEAARVSHLQEVLVETTSPFCTPRGELAFFMGGADHRLVRSDGTWEGTFQLRLLEDDRSDARFFPNGSMLFVDRNRLWTTDGTREGTRVLRSRLEGHDAWNDASQIEPLADRSGSVTYAVTTPTGAGWNASIYTVAY